MPWRHPFPSSCPPSELRQRCGGLRLRPCPESRPLPRRTDRRLPRSCERPGGSLSLALEHTGRPRAWALRSEARCRHPRTSWLSGRAARCPPLTLARSPPRSGEREEHDLHLLALQDSSRNGPRRTASGPRQARIDCYADSAQQPDAAASAGLLSASLPRARRSAPECRHCPNARVADEKPATTSSMSRSSSVASTSVT